MNKSILKNYAPKARTDFIQAVNDKAASYGITQKNTLPCEIKGDFAFINGQPFPKSVHAKREALLAQIDDHGFDYVIEEIAYTWFNRFVAIRFMEINGYLSHGYQVLSHPEGHRTPEIIEKAQFLGDLPGLQNEEIVRLKMAGDKDDELYEKLLLAQCNELNRSMPFLFEPVDDPTELLLPANLLHTGSIISDLVETIPEEDWKQAEIIGWLYQFYTAEKKDALMKAKKAYRTEDIPAVTQLFTPNWIVKYLLQNSLGAKWLRTYPNSSLKDKMDYYIEPAEQTPEVNAQIKEITPSILHPEELTVLDPACGSGHILVEAYDLLKEIYLERGYRKRDIPKLVLEMNLFGLEIDKRCAQLAGFALMMKARRDDPEILKRGTQPNVVVVKKGGGKIHSSTKEIDELIDLFEDAQTAGSLIRVPEDIQGKLPKLQDYASLKNHDDLFSQKDAQILIPLIRQAELLSRRYDVVVANPPYMGSKAMNTVLKDFARGEFPDTKSDTFAMFIERNRALLKQQGYSASCPRLCGCLFLLMKNCGNC